MCGYRVSEPHMLFRVTSLIFESLLVSWKSSDLQEPQRPNLSPFNNTKAGKKRFTHVEVRMMVGLMEPEGERKKKKGIRTGRVDLKGCFSRATRFKKRRSQLDGVHKSCSLNFEHCGISTPLETSEWMDTDHGVLEVLGRTPQSQL